MSDANVYTSASAQTWYTDKAKISTGANTVTFQVERVYGATGNIYTNPIQVPAQSTEYVWVGVGNRLTVVGGNVTIAECGTATSGKNAVRQP